MVTFGRWRFLDFLYKSTGCMVKKMKLLISWSQVRPLHGLPNFYLNFALLLGAIYGGASGPHIHVRSRSLRQGVTCPIRPTSLRYVSFTHIATLRQVNLHLKVSENEDCHGVVYAEGI